MVVAWVIGSKKEVVAVSSENEVKRTLASPIVLGLKPGQPGVGVGRSNSLM